MPKKRPRSGLEDANTRQLSEVYRSKLRQLDCRKNKKPHMSNIANKPVSSVSKQGYRKGIKLRRKRSLEDIINTLRKRKVKTVDTIAANSQEFGSQLYDNQKIHPTDCHKNKKLGSQHDNKIVQTYNELSRNQEDHQPSKVNKAFCNLAVECNSEEEPKAYIFEKSIEQKTAANDTSIDSLHQDIAQDQNEIFSPGHSPIRDTEAIKRKVCLKINRANSLLWNSTDENKLLEEVADGSKCNIKDKHRVTFKDSCSTIITEKGKTDGDLRTNIKKNPDFLQIECNTLDNSKSQKTAVKKIELLATTNKNSITETNESTVSLLSTSYLIKKTIPVKIDSVFRKVSEGNTFENKLEIKNSLDEKKGCPRYFEFHIAMTDVSNKDENKRGHIISFSFHELIVPILRSIQNFQLPVEFTLHLDEYFFIRNCPVVKCVSYLHRFPHSSPTNVWTFLCPTPSKIRMPNFIFISTALTPPAVLYNKKLNRLFENFMNIYSELKVGNNFVLLNLINDNVKPASTPYPLQFSTECENIISTALFNKLEIKINKARPTVIMETESIEDFNFDHPCLFQKFGNFKFVSLNIMPDVISENLSKVSPEKQVSVSLPFTVQRDSCSCMFVESKINLTCPIKAFLLTLTNNIRFIQSLTYADSTVRPLRDITSKVLSPKIKLPTKLKPIKKKILRFSRANRYKVKQLKKHGNRTNDENISFPNVKSKKHFQATEKNLHKVKRLKTQAFDENIVPLTVANENIIQSTVANSHKTKYLENSARKESSQSISPTTIPTVQVHKLGNLYVYNRKSILSCGLKNTQYPLVLTSQTNSSTTVTVSRAHTSSEFKTFLRNCQRGDQFKYNPVAPTIADEPFPLSSIKTPNTSNTSLHAASTHSATTAISGNENANDKSHSSFDLKTGKLSSETLTNLEPSIPSGILKFLVSSPQNSKNSATPISNLLQNISSTDNNIKTSTRITKTLTKSEQIGKKLVNAITIELNKSKSLSCHKITLRDSPTAAPADRAKLNLLGFMEVHFFEPIKGRNPNCRLSICIPKTINPTALSTDKIHIYPNAILSQSLDRKQKVLKTFLHVRKITNIQEIESFIFDHAFDENTSSPIRNGFDKQAFMFQPSHSKMMPPFTSSDFESLRRLNDSFLPNGMYLLTPVRKYGAYEIEIYKKLKNKHLNELKTEIGVCYNLGTECVKVEDLLNIPDNLFFASNAQLSDIF